MKKILLTLLVLFIPFFLFAQEVVEVIEPTDPPSGWAEILINPSMWLASFAGISLLTSFVAAFLTGLLKAEKSFIKQLIAWGVAIAILLVCDLANFKICYAWDFPIMLAIIHGFAAGLASNGFFDIPVLKNILKTVDGWFRPKPAEPAISK